MRLSGQTAIVTGAGRGIGRAIAEAFTAEGARVALVSRTAEELEALAREITTAGGVAKSFVADVSDLEQVREAVARVENAMGPVEVLMNNAGVHNGIATALASGRLDALTGRVVRPGDNLDGLEADVDRIVKGDLLTLRLRT